MSEQDRAAFLDLPQRLQDRPDREVMPKVLPDIEQERQAHTKRFSTPAKYRVACMQTVPHAFCCFYGLKNSNNTYYDIINLILLIVPNGLSSN